MIFALDSHGGVHFTAKREINKASDFVQFLEGLHDAVIGTRDYPLQEAIIWLDNATIHKTTGVKAALHESNYKLPLYPRA